MSIGFETLLNLNRNWMNRKSARLSKGMRIYIFETNNLSAYYAQSNNSTHDLTIKVFCILHQTYLFVHSVEKGSKVIALDTWQLNTTKAWWLTKKTYVYFVIEDDRETSSRLRRFPNICFFMLINGDSLSWPLQISSLSKKD